MTGRTLHRPLAFVSVLLGLVLGAAPARAQITVAPEGVPVSLPQHEEAVRTVTLTNTGGTSLAYCVSFDRPLQRRAGQARLVEGAAGAGAPCGPYGEVLYRYDEAYFGAGFNLYSITMTPEGRIFVAESSFPRRTFEFTPGLQLVRYFTQPFVAEFEHAPATTGITYDTESGTLWWMNLERSWVGGRDVTHRILLLEGDVGGEATGRRIKIVPPDEPLADLSTGGLSYDPATDLFYFHGISGDRDNPANWRLWAVDREGVVPGGYPVRPEPYPNGIFNIQDAHGGAEGGLEGVRIEYGAYPPGAPGNDRIVVVDRWGQNLGAELETPVPAVLFEAGGAGVSGNPLRSRVDPNGVMYMTFRNFDNEGIVGVRPHPLPPSWLRLNTEAGPEAAWDGTLAPGESREVALTFRAGARVEGAYMATLQVFNAATEVVVEVPLVLEVTPGTAAEATPEAAGPLRLGAPYPNPARWAVTVPLAVAQSGAVRVVLLDVLGREVAVLHNGPLALGEHAFLLDASALPAGLYLLRAATPGATASHRLTVVR